MKKIKNTKEETKGITLISLIITIILLLILAGITITQLTENGIFGQAKKAKERTEYTSAKEIIEIKLMEIQTDCIYQGKKYTITEIAKSIKKDNEITIEKYFNEKIALIKEDLQENLENLEGIIVSVNNYSKYKFLIGKNCTIERVTTKEITDTTEKEDLETKEEFEEKLFGKENINNSEKEEEIEIPSIGEDIDTTKPIEITTYMSIKSNSKNKLNIIGVENVNYTIQEKTDNVNLIENILIANNIANSNDNCKIQITGTYNEQSYTNNLIIYVEPKNTTTIEGEDYYRIYTVQDLVRLRELTNHNIGSIKNAVMMNDIDLQGIDWIPMGYSELNTKTIIAEFKGIFDGQNYTIKNMKINNPSDSNKYNIGFIGILNGGIIKNLKFDNANVYSETTHAAIVVGYSYNNSIIENVQILSGTNEGTICTSGICGENDESTIRYCSNNSKITGSDNVGGINGKNSKGSIEECYNEGIINANKLGGGISGTNRGIIEKCYNTGEIMGNAERIGGINGDNYAIIKNCYNKGKVTGTVNEGGISGSNSGADAIVECCYNMGAVGVQTGERYNLGGIVGGNASGIENCYNIGNIENDITVYNVGGIVGVIQKVSNTQTYDAYIKNCYNVGNVITAGNVTGGIVGGIGSPDCKVTNCSILNLIKVKYRTTEITTQYGNSRYRYGRFIGWDQYSSVYTDIKELTKDTIPTVYDVLNKFNSEQSTIWSNSNPNEPKLLWQEQ